MSRILYSCIALCVLGSFALRPQSAIAQSFNPYRHVTDPESLAILDATDSEAVQGAAGVGWPSEYTPDLYYIMAQNRGSGILTHMWFNLQNVPDSNCVFRIVIDDSVIYNGYMKDCFTKSHNLLRPPFDSLGSSSFLLDLQLPYRRNMSVQFKASFTSCCLFWQVTYRPIRDSNTISSMAHVSSELVQHQIAAETAIWKWGSSYSENSPLDIKQSAELIAGDTMMIGDLAGPGIIHRLNIKTGTQDSSILRQIILQAFWDRCPNPSINISLADFFGQSCGPREMHGFLLRTDSTNGFNCYYPMPFFEHAQLRLINRSQVRLPVNVELTYVAKPIDRKSYGYFSAQHFEENPALYHILHPVAFARGRGRLVGVQLAVPFNPIPYFLEGNPKITVDSDNVKYIEYTGTEDFFGGGWFFADGKFSLPFTGATSLYTTFYRELVFDCIDFKKSFDFTLEHGDQNKFTWAYQTTAFLYTRWVQFWFKHDTVTIGGSEIVSGTGYQPGATIVCSIDNRKIFETTADNTGAFSYTFTIPPTLVEGGHDCDVNGEHHAFPLWVLKAPQIHTLHALLPYLNFRDTITIWGTGFKPGEHVRFQFDTFELHPLGPVVVDSTCGFTIQAIVPWAKDGRYPLTAIGDMGTVTHTDSSYRVTRWLHYECERMWPPLSATGYSRPDYMGYFKEEFSSGWYLLMVPDQPGRYLTVPFYVPVADTYRPILFAATSPRFADYSILIDNTLEWKYSGYSKRDPNDPIRSDSLFASPISLSAGWHTMTFLCTGRNTAGGDLLLGADDLVLQPTTPFDPLAGVNPPTVTEPAFHLKGIAMSAFPNPNKGDELHLEISLPEQIKDHDQLDVSLVDLSGKSLKSIYRGSAAYSHFYLDERVNDLPSANYFCVMDFFSDGKLTRVTVPISIAR